MDRGSGLDLAVASIAAEEEPTVAPPVQKMLGALDELSMGVRMPPAAEAPEAVARLNLHLFEQEGFAGDMETYEHPQNSLLHRVLQRRRGLPILLSVVYMEVAHRCGVEFQGIGFPGHFLIAPAVAEKRFYVDPFNTGRILTRDALTDRLTRMSGRRPGPAEVDAALRPVGAGHILVRINNNLKGAHLRRDDIAGAIRAVRRMLAVAPHLPSERRDLALMTAHLGEPARGATELRAYLEASPDAPGATTLAKVAERLERAGSEADPADEEE